MKFEISKEEMIALINELSHNWISIDNQRLVYDVVKRMETELEKDKEKT